MKVTALSAAALLALGSASHAADLEITLGSQAAAVHVLADSDVIGVGGADLDFGVLFNDDSDVMGSLGLLVRGTPAGNPPWSFGLGGRLYYASIDSPDRSVGALALGGSAMYHIPGHTPMAFGGDLFYAPAITTFSDGDSFLHWGVRFEADVLPAATAFLGYRKVTADLDRHGDYDIDDSFHVGVRFQF